MPPRDRRAKYAAETRPRVKAGQKNALQVAPTGHLQARKVSGYVDLQKRTDGEGRNANSDHGNGHAGPIDPTVPANGRKYADGYADSYGESQSAEPQEEGVGEGLRDDVAHWSPLARGDTERTFRDDVLGINEVLFPKGLVQTIELADVGLGLGRGVFSEVKGSPGMALARKR